MNNPTDDIKTCLRQLNWKKLKSILNTLPATQEVFEEISQLIWHTDSMVRRRPGDDGRKRDTILSCFGEYYQVRGVPEAVNDIEKMRTELFKIDRGYEEIHALVPKMNSAKLSPEQRIAGAFAALDYAMRQTLRDADRKLDADNGVIGTERNLRDSEGNSYDPDSNTHGLTLACGDVLMLEAYREGWFDAANRIVLPNLDPASDDERDAVVANLLNANMWRLWKRIDERVRFLGGNLEQFLQPLPEWGAQIHAKNPDIDIEVAFEFTPKIINEQFEVLANERFYQFSEQNLKNLLRETNVIEKLTPAGDFVALPPQGLISIDEAHAATILCHFTKTDICKTHTGALLLSERLRGYAVLKLFIVKLEKEQKTYFPRVTSTRLLAELERCGLTTAAANKFIDLATFERSSRDLYDQPLVKTVEDDFFLFGPSLLLADLTKLIFSSLANEGVIIEDKGKMFEEAIINLLHGHGFNARKLKIKRGMKKEHEFDYDVVFTWDDFVFFLECKNRGIPMGNPIATYRFNQEMFGHLQQVGRLRQGLVDYPDILDKDFPEAVGKKAVFCLVNALPFAMGKVNDIYVIDYSILSRFFSSSSIGATAGQPYGTGPQFRTELLKIWSGPKPTALDFINYMTVPPQLNFVKEYYEIAPNIERLSLGAFAKVNDFRRKEFNDAAIAKILRKIQTQPSSRQP